MRSRYSRTRSTDDASLRRMDCACLNASNQIIRLYSSSRSLPSTANSAGPVPSLLTAAAGVADPHAVASSTPA